MTQDPELETVRGFADLVVARAADDAVGLMFEDQSWTWREVVDEARRRAALAARLRRPGPWHIGLLLENTPEQLFWWLGAALAGATVVGINPTRRGAELERDIAFTDCQLLLADTSRTPLLDTIDSGIPPERMLRTDSAHYHAELTQAGAAKLPTGEDRPDPRTALSLIFTSGTTSAPKPVICSQARMARIALQQRQRRDLGADDVFYVAMPMFHSNAIMAGVAPALHAGGRIVLRRHFSASGFLPDVRHYGVTFFNYVGKPLNYILSTPEHADDADNTLRIAFGNEANERDIAEFSRRFGCAVIDSYGTSEGEITIRRTPETPSGSLGVAGEGTVVLDPGTLRECPPAKFDADGVLLNGAEAIGEIVHKKGAELFEGYYNNPDAERRRLRHGWIFSGDLAYRDEAGFWYFAGRDDDWLRVNGENIAAAPVERLLSRFPAFAAVAVLGVPDPDVGDQMLAVAELAGGRRFDPEAFRTFLAEQPDLGTKWTPRYLRLVDELPRTATNKVLKRSLRAGAADALRDAYVRDEHGGYHRLS